MDIKCSGTLSWLSIIVFPILSFFLGYCDQRRFWALARYTKWWNRKDAKPEILYQLADLPEGYWCFSAEMRYLRKRFNRDPRTMNAAELEALKRILETASQRIPTLLDALK